MNSMNGHLLVASPKLGDPNFFRSVVLIVQHNEDGALGLVLNRPLEATIASVWDQVSDTPCSADNAIHRGGPCDGPLMLLHDDPELSQMEVMPEVYFTTEKDAVEQLVAAAGEGARIKFFVGYAGWSPGQLEAELEENAWLTMPATAAHVFATESEEQWDAVRREIARASAVQWVDPRFIPDDPSVN